MRKSGVWGLFFVLMMVARTANRLVGLLLLASFASETERRKTLPDAWYARYATTKVGDGNIDVDRSGKSKMDYDGWIVARPNRQDWVRCLR